MLYRTEVDAVITLIEKDALAAAAINDPLGDNTKIGRFIPDTWAGGVRNVKLMLSGKNPHSDSDTYWKVCIGIAETVSSLVNANLKRTPALWRVRNVGTITRNAGATGKTDHTATTLTMDDGQTHVLDWHATLNVRNPALFRSEQDFLADKSVTYENWQKWD